MLWSPFSGGAWPGWERQTAASDEPASWRGIRGSLGAEASLPARLATRRIIFLNRFFFPDHSATSQILTDLAFHLAGCGIDVRVVTSQQRYDDPSAHLIEAETIR